MGVNYGDAQIWNTSSHDGHDSIKVVKGFEVTEITLQKPGGTWHYPLKYVEYLVRMGVPFLVLPEIKGRLSLPLLS